VQLLLARTTLARLRLSSLDGAEADDALVEALGDARVMPHVHLSLQHGDDLMLKRMKRRHSRADALRLVERLRHARPDVALGADIIAGFPTEGEAAHAANLSLLAEAGIVHAHVFPYSERAGTPAARMPQVAPTVRAARAAELRAVAAGQRAAWLRGFVGQRVRAVSEGARGWSAHYAPVATAAPRGTVEDVDVVRIADGVLSA
jgi:threonylcarbamoyladenosine tRNA methylthiotransferase MtaB